MTSPPKRSANATPSAVFPVAVGPTTASTGCLVLSLHNAAKLLFQLLPGQFEGNAALEDCVEKLKQASRNYAKRQLTWFRHMDGVVWLDAAAPDVTEQAVRLTQDFLAKG